MAKASPARAKLDKGSDAEEALRKYFLSLGAYVIRGVPVVEGADTITDVDLWTYTRASVHARHVAIVDVKNKKRAKGYERVVWLRGLQELVGADEAVIASTSTRENLKPFADRVNVRVIGSQVLTGVLSRYVGQDDRLTSEELFTLWRNAEADDGQKLNLRMEANLQEVGRGISFSALNHWIDDAGKLLTWSLDHERTPGAHMRAALLSMSLVALAADYLGRELAFSDHDRRKEFFKSGIIFGRTDGASAQSYLNFAETAVTDFVDRSGASAAMLKMGFNRAVENLPVAPFIEFFARPTAGKELYEAALRLEAAAFARQLPPLVELKAEAKVIIGLIADYMDLDRKRLLGSNRPIEERSREPSASLKAASSDKLL